MPFTSLSHQRTHYIALVMSPHGLSMHCHAGWVYTKTPSPYGVCLEEVPLC